MKKSEDVSKLFAMFGEKNTDQYQEIYQAEQNQATRERWPVFQRVHVDADRPAVAPVAPTPKPVPASTQVQASPAQHAAPPTPTNQPAQPIAPVAAVAPTPVQDAPTQVPPVQMADTPAAPTPTSPNPMFRFSGHAAAAPTHENATDPVATPAAAISSQPEAELSGNLSSLFKRLQGQPEEPAALPEVAVAPTPEPAQGSIRSLFSRLSR